VNVTETNARLSYPGQILLTSVLCARAWSAIEASDIRASAFSKVRSDAIGARSRTGRVGKASEAPVIAGQSIAGRHEGLAFAGISSGANGAFGGHRRQDAGDGIRLEIEALGWRQPSRGRPTRVAAISLSAARRCSLLQRSQRFTLE
jgi:hypothetical protein